MALERFLLCGSGAKGYWTPIVSILDLSFIIVDARYALLIQMITLKYLIRSVALSCFFLSSVLVARADEAPSQLPQEPPIATLEGQPYITVTIDQVYAKKPMSGPGRSIRHDETTEEQMLQRAFSSALKRSRLKYAYTLYFEKVPRKGWVPQLNLAITRWEFRRSGASECIVDAFFYDASGERHDLRGAIGFESTSGMTSDRYEQERYLELAARDAFSSILRSIQKKNLYRY